MPNTDLSAFALHVTLPEAKSSGKIAYNTHKRPIFLNCNTYKQLFDMRSWWPFWKLMNTRSVQKLLFRPCMSTNLVLIIK